MLDYTSAPRTAKHCIATVTWAWSPARILRLVPGAGVWVEPEPGLAAPGLCVCGLGLAGHLPGLPRLVPGLACLRRRLLATGSQSFHTKVPEGSHEQLRPTRFPTLPSESFKRVRFGCCARACGHENFPLFRQRVSRGFVSEVC